MIRPEGLLLVRSLDLHVLGTPPAFILSQDQTLKDKSLKLTGLTLRYFIFKVQRPENVL